jgi:uncharacterized membrane protein
MVQIAVRALSPGINDPYTALICIDWLGALLGQMAERKIPSRYRYDDRKRLRIIADPITFTQLADAEFTQIRQYGRDHAGVLTRLLEVIADLAEHVRREQGRVTLRHHAQLIEQDSRETIPDGEDRRQIEACYQRALQALTGREGSEPGAEPRPTSTVKGLPPTRRLG